MIDPKATTTYAQYNEDIILEALLADVKKGFYIDVGANYPTIDSVTKRFYDRGWRGINIEPIESLWEQLKTERPRDVNLHCGIGDSPGTTIFHEFIDVPGHSTFRDATKDKNAKNTRSYEVQIKTLKQIIGEHKPRVIHFIKIDVEGFEYEVIAGNDWVKNRPEVICIEANHLSKDWATILKKHNYKLFIADGLNEYYVAKEAWQRTVGFTERAIMLDYHALKQHQWQSWSADSKDLVRLHSLAKANHKEIKKLHYIAPLSLRGQTYPRRLKRALQGLSIDWIKYRYKRYKSSRN